MTFNQPSCIIIDFLWLFYCLEMFLRQAMIILKITSVCSHFFGKNKKQILIKDTFSDAFS